MCRIKVLNCKILQQGLSLCVEISIQIKNITKNCPNRLDTMLVFGERQLLGAGVGRGLQGLLRARPTVP